MCNRRADWLAQARNQQSWPGLPWRQKPAGLQRRGLRWTTTAAREGEEPASEPASQNPSLHRHPIKAAPFLTSTRDALIPRSASHLFPS